MSQRTPKAARPSGCQHFWLPLVLALVSLPAMAQETVFVDDFESGDLSAWSSFVPPDGTPPVLTLEPGEGSIVSTDPPEITVGFGDAVSGIDPTSLVLTLDDVDLLPDCTVGPLEAVCVPGSAIGVGAHQIEASVRDRAGNLAEASSTFTVSLEDLEAPLLTLVEPSSEIVTELAPTIVLSYSDAGSGVDLASLSTLVDGSDVTVTCTVDPGIAVCLAPVLAPGAHRIDASIRDLAGNPAALGFDFTVDLSPVDSVPPTVTITSPTTDLVNADSVAILAGFADAESGLELGSLEVLLDEVPVADCVATSSTVSCTAPLVLGEHVVRVRIEDRADNPGEQIRAFSNIEDLEAPTLVRLEPMDLVLFDNPTPTVVLGLGDGISAIDPSSFYFQVDGSDATGDCEVSTIDATCALVLDPGLHPVVARIDDIAGNTGELSFEFDIRISPVDTTAPTIAFLAPGATVKGASVLDIELAYSDAVAVATSSLSVGLDGVDITAGCQIRADGATCTTSEVARGAHVLTAAIADSSGNIGTAGLEVDVDPLLDVSIIQPAPLGVTREASIELLGTVDPPASSVTVGTASAELAGTAFSVTLPLVEGSNTFTAVATTESGGIGTATRTVVRDTTAPRVRIRAPTDGLLTSSPQIAVTGDALDIASSNMVLTPLEVRVNGLPAPIENDAFALFDVLLQPGENRIEVTAVDAAGNVGSASATVHRVTPSVGRLEELLGNGQTGIVGEPLANPLVVRVVDGLGRPLVGREVHFDVSRGDGLIRSAGEEQRQVIELTDENGLARVDFVLGTRAGAGLHEVKVESIGIPGVVIFCANANAGAPARIRAVLGDNNIPEQLGVAGRTLPEPLLAQVFDADGNFVPGADVTFQVLKGTGSFDGASFAVVTTDEDGKAAVEFTLGQRVAGDPEAASDIVEALVDGINAPTTLFLATALEPSAMGNTGLSGIVLDNQDDPVPGVVMHIADTALSTVTDAAGQFAFADVPVGTILLEVDGTTTPRPGTWPHLHFKLTTVSGADNDLGMPIRLLPLDIDGGRIVGGDEDVTLELAGVPGAELTIFANSVTFPDGSTEGLVSFTQVHSNKVPMQPPMGSDFMIAWTVQPSGAFFDPPARIAIPNSGMPPGSVVDIFSFDHDLGEFLPIGTATVTEDGSQIVSDPGVGVIKAGWHGCVPPPPPRGNACSPGRCSACSGESQRPVSICDGDCERCGSGGCEPVTIDEVEVTGNEESETVVTKVGEVVEFVAQPEGDCGDYTYDWSFPGAEEPSGTRSASVRESKERMALTKGSAEESRTYPEPGEFEASAEVGCASCPNVAPQNAKVKVVAVKVDIQMLALPEETDPMPHEENPGAWVPLNPNRNNHQAGNNDSVPVLLEITIPQNANLPMGKAKLELTKGQGRVRVYEDANFTKQVNLPKTWNLTDPDFPRMATFFVEGVTLSSALRDAELQLSFSSGKSMADDKVAVTVGDLRFIDDNNTPIPQTGPDAFLAISNEKTDLQLPASATFAGPPTGDKDNFRLEATGLASGLNIEFGLTDPTLQWIGSYQPVFQQDKYRMDKHIRLVSSTVDDAHGGDQTGKVLPGVEITGELFLDGFPLAERKLKVFRPSSENHANALRSATATFIPVALPGVTGVSSAVAFQRLDEVWAQCAVDFGGGQQAAVTPYTNAFYVEGTAMAAGTLIIQVDSVFLPPTKVTAGDSPQTVASAVEASIRKKIQDGGLPAGTTVDTFLVDATTGESWVVVDKGKRNVMFRTHGNPPAGLMFGPVMSNYSTPLDYADEWLLSVNYGDNDPTTIEFFVVPTGHLASTNRADAWPPCSLGAQASPTNHSFLELRVADGDATHPHTVSHEAARFILNSCSISGFPPFNLLDTTATLDRIDANKRLTDGQCSLARTAPGGTRILK